MRFNIQRLAVNTDLGNKTEDYLREVVLNTVLLFGEIFDVPEEEKETFMVLVCSTVEEVFNNLDPGYTWKIECYEEETE